MKLLPAILVSVLLLALPAQGSPRGESKVQTIRLISRTVKTRVLLDRAPKGASKGDKVWEKSNLRNAVAQLGRPKGALVGSDVAVATLISAARTRLEVTATLPGGKIRAAGTISDVK